MRVGKRPECGVRQEMEKKTLGSFCNYSEKRKVKKYTMNMSWEKKGGILCRDIYGREGKTQ